MSMSKLLSEFILGINTKLIRDKVIVAPCWMPESVGITEAKKISDNPCKIWDCVIKDKAFTYIVTGVGASVCMDIVLAMKDTVCKQILFIGSAGALRDEINIGDFVVPNGAISAEGASRYIGNDLAKDVLGKYFHATKELQHRVFSCLKNEFAGLELNVYEGIGISVESILLQYKHIDDLLDMKCDFIDMEASAFLAACNSINVQGAVVFCISDNVMQNEPLYKVSCAKKSYRKKIRKKIMPLVLKEFIYGFKE